MKIKFTKKRIIIGVIAAVVVFSIISSIIKAKNTEPELDYDIGKIERQTLMNTIGCSGNIKAEETKNITSVLVGSKITNVNVEVGDTVDVGEVLLSFDVDQLRKTAGTLAASINATREQTNISINSADRAVNDATNNKNTSLDSARAARDQAQNAFNQATNAKNSQLPALQASLAALNQQATNYAAIETAYNQASQAVASAQVTYTTAEATYGQLQAQSAADPTNEPLLGQVSSALTAKNNAATDLDTAKTNLTVAKASYDNIKAPYGEIKSQIATTSSAISALEQGVSQTKAAYDQASTAYNNASANLDSALLGAQDAAASARINARTATLNLEDQLSATNKQLADANLKSTVSGTVTSVTAKKGDTYQGGTLLTIEGVESFIVEVNVDEYDVADIKEGMEAIIKTDATRDEELKGKVIFVSPISNEDSTSSGASGTYGAAMTGSSTGSSATYRVKIEVLTYSDRLRLGMSAKVSIVMEKAENVLAVPYDAITENDKGEKIITIIKDDETQEEIPVEVGLESGYYSEVKSDKIKEGMRIVLPKVSGNSTLDDLLESMGATGGIE